MRRLFWLAVIFGTYLWVLTSGRDQFLLEKGKALYETIAKWIDSADADFHLDRKSSKKKSHRWD